MFLRCVRYSRCLTRFVLLSRIHPYQIRYHNYALRLAAREFSVARAKRDALTIVRIGNRARLGIVPRGGAAAADPFRRNDGDDDNKNNNNNNKK